jgi:hypothetical protein
MSFFEQVTAVALLVDFFLGVTCGVVGGAAHGSRREDRGYTMLGAAPDPVSAGARILHGVYTSADENAMRFLPGGEVGGDNYWTGSSGAQGQELDQ